MSDVSVGVLFLVFELRILNVSILNVLFACCVFRSYYAVAI